MAKNLVIVESPAKAKTIGKYLGRDYQILASFGHVRDLVPKEGAVDPEHHFKMRYEAIEKNAKHMAEISKAVQSADKLFLAPDPDREGEAIAWHVYEMLKAKKRLKDKQVFRISFNEITQTAIREAVAHPRKISMDLVNAQQARRALDYLVGFNLSPLLWKKIRRGLSAGRVQSPALRMIVEREEAIEKFDPKEYWSINANVIAKDQAIVVRLTQYQGKKVEQFSFTNEKDTRAAEKTLNQAAQGKLVVSKVEQKQRKRNPTAPFITSTLQQEASRKLGFGARRTMRIAQSLYEGVDIGQGTVGLISYMRTDSVNLANDAIAELRDFISKQYGEDNLPKSPRVYKTKAKNAQEAHEAIRPTAVINTPDKIKKYLTADQHKLYQLIWKRTVACQMIHATLNVVAIDFACGQDHLFRVTGSTIANPGFMQIYLEGVDDGKKRDDEENLLPALAVGDEVDLKEIISEQHFTEPPPRYSEATLVKALEEYGIGRPSTYAGIIDTLQAREYAILDNKRFKPTDVGRIVSHFLTNYFTQYVDYGFTAKLEDQLDAISRGETDYIPILEKFWQPFKKLVETTETDVKREDVTQEKLDENCPKCNKPLSIRLGRRGRFIGCTGYPECDYTRNLGEDKETAAAEPEVVEGRQCPKCGSDLIIRQGRYGKFIGCSNYPKCKHMEPLEKPENSGVQCPACKQSTLFKRKSRYGTYFYSCARYPECKYAVSNEPLNEPCPQCKWPILMLKTTKKYGTQKVCPQKKCDYQEAITREQASGSRDQ